MLKFMPYVVKSLWGHRMRTVLTVSGTAVALFVFFAVSAMWQGLVKVTSGAQHERRLIVFQANRYCPSASRLPADYAERIRGVDGVADVLPIKAYTNNCRASLDVVIFHGVPPAKVQDFRNLQIVDGDFAAFAARQDAALVGRALAQRRRLATGQRFAIGGLNVLVAGVYASEIAAEDHMAIVQLDFLQRAPGLRSVGSVTQFEVLLAADAPPETVAPRIDALFRSAPVSTVTRAKGAFQANVLGDLADLVAFARWLTGACILLVMALVTATMVMNVQDRRGEHAVLQAIGFSGRRILGLVVFESELVSLAGGAIGIATAIAALSLHRQAIGTEGVVIAVEPSFTLAIWGFVVAAFVGLLAGAVPGWQATRASIVDALRAL